MTVRNPPTFLEGGHHHAEDLRLSLVQFAGKNEGVGTALDFIATATGSSGNITIGDGDALIKGDDSVYQGMYHLNNTGAITIPVPPTSSTARKDIIVARVEDPQYVGNADPDSTAARIELITGTASAYPAVPNTAIKLYNVDVPASTSLITQAMITDQRVIANPRRDRILLINQPSATYPMPAGLTPVLWPSAGTTGFGNITIPSWATYMIAVVHMAGLLNTGGSSTAGGIRIVVGGISGLIQGQDTAVASGVTNERITTVVAYQGVIPAAYRGTTQVFGTAGYHPTGGVNVDSYTTIVSDITFQEKLT